MEPGGEPTIPCPRCGGTIPAGPPMLTPCSTCRRLHPDGDAVLLAMLREENRRSRRRLWIMGIFAVLSVVSAVLSLVAAD